MARRLPQQGHRLSTKGLSALALAFALAVVAQAQKPIGSGKTVRHHTETIQSVAPAVQQAEAALEQQDLATAEKLLTKVVAADPNDYRAWYDLGFVYNATKRTDDAITAYRKAVAAKPDIFEANLNLGILLARENNPDAETFLRNATKLKPSAKASEGLERAWLSLGHVLEQKDPAAAVDAFQHAAQLQPKDPEPHLSAGLVLEKKGDFAAAAKEYQASAALDPKSAEALAGIVNAATRGGDLPGAEMALREYLRLNPRNPAAQAQLGRILALEKKPEAVAELEAALALNPQDHDVQHELAMLYVQSNQFSKAEEMLRPQVASSGANADLHHIFGVVLLNEHKYAEAQDQLLQAVKLDPRMADAYGDLATAAYRNKNYPLAIQALDAHGKLVPDPPGVFFLRAQAYDQLQDYSQAAENYNKFLEASNGKFPDQEWQARHRLVAIEPESKKKKK